MRFEHDRVCSLIRCRQPLAQQVGIAEDSSRHRRRAAGVGSAMRLGPLVVDRIRLQARRTTVYLPQILGISRKNTGAVTRRLA